MESAKGQVLLLLVIFGAGASSDSSPAYPTPMTVGQTPSRPPLASELFDMRFGDVIDHFPRAKPVMTHLLPRVGQPVNVEGVLEGLQTKALAGEKEEYRQLSAVQYYLQAMLVQCTWRWNEITKGVTNYAALLEAIRGLKEPVCLVTFNYDTLLEEALSLPTFGVRFRSLDDYVSTNYKVIKVHGSVSWAHEIITPIENIRGRDQLQIASEVIDRRPDLVVDRGVEIVYPVRYDIENGFPIGKSGDRAVLPALAVPVENKPGDELPEAHLKVLEGCLPQVTKVLVIGWRANETRFLKSFAEGLARGRAHPSFMIVSGTEKGAQQVAIRIIEKLGEAGVVGYGFKASQNGFTYAIRDLEIQGFLNMGR